MKKMQMTQSFEIRELSDNDFINWKTLWTQYLEFYKTSVENLVYEIISSVLLSTITGLS